MQNLRIQTPSGKWMKCWMSQVESRDKERKQCTTVLRARRSRHLLCVVWGKRNSNNKILYIVYSLTFAEKYYDLVSTSTSYISNKMSVYLSKKHKGVKLPNLIWINISTRMNNTLQWTKIQMKTNNWAHISNKIAFNITLCIHFG